MLAASKGLVLMAPPSGNADAQKTMAALLSGIKPKSKVRTAAPVGAGFLHACWCGAARSHPTPQSMHAALQRPQQHRWCWWLGYAARL